MRFLKLTFADNNTYTLCTFTISEMKVMKREQAKYQDMEDDINKINCELDEDGKIKLDEKGNWIYKNELKEEEKEEIAELEDRALNFLVDILRKSLCRKHKEFKRLEDKEEDNKIKERLMDMVDMSDLKKIMRFSFSGTYEHEIDVYDYSTENKEDGK